MLNVTKGYVHYDDFAFKPRLNNKSLEGFFLCWWWQSHTHKISTTKKSINFGCTMQVLCKSECLCSFSYVQTRKDFPFNAFSLPRQHHHQQYHHHRRWNIRRKRDFFTFILFAVRAIIHENFEHFVVKQCRHKKKHESF